jgi:hypothetical protein
LLVRYTRELDRQEDRLATLQKQADERKAKREGLQARFDTMVQTISINENSKAE